MAVYPSFFQGQIEIFNCLYLIFQGQIDTVGCLSLLSQGQSERVLTAYTSFIKVKLRLLAVHHPLVKVRFLTAYTSFLKVKLRFLTAYPQFLRSN